MTIEILSDVHDFCPFCGRCRVCGRTFVSIRQLLQDEMDPLAKCKPIEVEEEAGGFSITCPGCSTTTTWTMFGSDWKCSTCGEWHYWYGGGWIEEGEKWVR